MKRKMTLLTLALGCLSLWAFTPKSTDGDLVKVSVVHHEGGKVMVLDTTFDAASGYTVEQFLLDNGLDPATTEIIDANTLNGPFTHDVQHNVWFMSEPGDCEKAIFRTFDGDEPHVIRREMKGGDGAQEIKITKTVGPDGEIQTRKFVNGEESELGDDDMLWIDENGEEHSPTGDYMFIEESDEGDGQNVVIRRIAPSGDNDGDQPMKVRVYKGDNAKGGTKSDDGTEVIEMNVEVEKFVGDDGVETIQMWINGEEVDPADYEDLLIDGGNGEGEVIIIIDGENSIETENVFIFEGGEGQPDVEVETEQIFIFEGDCEGMNKGMMHEMMGNMSYTLAIVSRVDDKVQNDSEKSLESKPETSITDLKFSPNPNAGQFNLSFNLPNKGRTAVKIFDLQGKLVFEDNLGKFSGQYQQQIDISKAGPGTYILNIIQGQEKLVEKIIVQ